MPNVIQIKRTTTSSVPTSNSGGDITAGELAYSYSAADGSGNESGVGKLFIGHADGLAGANAAAIIGGSFFTNMLDHTAGTATANSAVLLDGNLHTDHVKTTNLHIGNSGSATQVTATGAELNILGGATLSTSELNTLTGITASTTELNKIDGYTGTTAQLNTVDVTPGTLTASKAVVVDSDQHIDNLKTGTLHLGAAGSTTAVTASATELNLLDGITEIDTDITSVAATHTTLASAKAIKAYVDSNRAGLEVKDSCRVATTANLTATYNNGASGVGATLTNSGSQAAIAIDGVTLNANERVLVKDQTSAAHNGIYKVTDVGNGSTNWILTRTTDADTTAELNSGVFTFVEGGSSNENHGFTMTQDTTINFGTTTVTWTQFSGTGMITDGNGLSKSGNTMAVNTGTGITITSDNVVIDTAWAGQAAITTVGTIGTGTWAGTAVASGYGGTGIDTSSSTGIAVVTSGTWSISASLGTASGGTGATSFTSNGILYGNGTGAIQVTAAGTNGYFLYSNAGTPAWTNVIDGGTF